MISTIEILWGDMVSPYSSFTERIMAFVVLLLIAAVVILAIGLVFWEINSMGLKPNNSQNTAVIDSRIIPAQSRFMIIGNGKSTNTTPIARGKSYIISYMIKDKKIESKVTHELYNNISPGDKIEVKYSKGRIFGNIEPTEINKIE